MRLSLSDVLCGFLEGSIFAGLVSIFAGIGSFLLFESVSSADTDFDMLRRAFLIFS